MSTCSWHFIGIYTHTYTLTHMPHIHRYTQHTHTQRLVYRHTLRYTHTQIYTNKK